MRNVLSRSMGKARKLLKSELWESVSEDVATYMTDGNRSRNLYTDLSGQGHSEKLNLDKFILCDECNDRFRCEAEN